MGGWSAQKQEEVEGQSLNFLGLFFLRIILDYANSLGSMWTGVHCRPMSQLLHLHAVHRAGYVHATQHKTTGRPSAQLAHIVVEESAITRQLVCSQKASSLGTPLCGCARAGSDCRCCTYCTTPRGMYIYMQTSTALGFSPVRGRCTVRAGRDAHAMAQLAPASELSVTSQHIDSNARGYVDDPDIRHIYLSGYQYVPQSHVML